MKQEFEVGDRVEVIRNRIKGEIKTLSRDVYPIGVILDSPAPTEVILLNGGYKCEDWCPEGKGKYMWIGEEDDLKFISRGEKTSRYQELKNQIQGWTGSTSIKEVDDVIGEIRKSKNHTIMTFHDDQNSGYGSLDVEYPSAEKTFYWENQYQKLTALKDACMWLLDNSELKDTKKIKQLRKDYEEARSKMEKFERELRALEEK